MKRRVGFLVAAIAVGFVHAGEVPRPAFSFKYGDRAVAGSESLQVDAHLKVTVEVENLDTGVKSTVTGDLEIALPARRSSTVLLYRVNGRTSPRPAPGT